MNTNEATANNPVLLGRYHDITLFTSDDETRYILQGVHYNPTKRVLEACDGHILIRVPVCEHAEDFPQVKAGCNVADECNIPASALKKAVNNLPKSSTYPVLQYARLSANGDSKATLTTSDMDTEQSVTVKSIEGNYPNVDQVIPDKAPTFSITLAAELLKKIADYAVKHGVSDGRHVGVRFDFTKDTEAARFSINLNTPMDGKVKAEGVLMPMRMM